MLRLALALGIALPALAGCSHPTPGGGYLVPLGNPGTQMDADRRQAELRNPTFGTRADRGRGAPLAVAAVEPVETGGRDYPRGTSSLPPALVSPAAPTNAMTAAYNRETEAMMRAAEAPLPGARAGAPMGTSAPAPATAAPVAATPLASAADTTAVAAFALATDHDVGEQRYVRRQGGLTGDATACERYESADEAQRTFLAVGGPDSDPLGLDPDGDGFACAWSPAPYRRMVGE